MLFFFTDKIAYVSVTDDLTDFTKHVYVGETLASFPLADTLRGYEKKVGKSGLRQAFFVSTLGDLFPDYLFVHLAPFSIARLFDRNRMDI